MKRVSLCSLFSVLALGTFSLEDEPSKQREVELIYLANEGFLVRSEDESFVIDAFLETPLGAYAALPSEVHADLAAARGPFEGVDLALVSHVHPDHFQPASARAFLASSKDTQLATSPQVLESLETVLGEDEEADTIRARLHSFLPVAGERLDFEHEGIEIEFLRLPHAGNRPNIQNLGHLVRFAGLTLLHVGDAEGDVAVFETYELDRVEIDVALLPYWYWRSPAGQKLVREELNADTLVAVHVPPREVGDTVALLAEGEYDVHVFRTALQTLVLGTESHGH